MNTISQKPIHFLILEKFPLIIQMCSGVKSGCSFDLHQISRTCISVLPGRNNEILMKKIEVQNANYKTCLYFPPNLANMEWFKTLVLKYAYNTSTSEIKCMRIWSWCHYIKYWVYIYMCDFLERNKDEIYPKVLYYYLLIIRFT